MLSSTILRKLTFVSLWLVSPFCCCCPWWKETNNEGGIWWSQSALLSHCQGSTPVTWVPLYLKTLFRKRCTTLCRNNNIISTFIRSSDVWTIRKRRRQSAKRHLLPLNATRSVEDQPAKLKITTSQVVFTLKLFIYNHCFLFVNNGIKKHNTH